MKKLFLLLLPALGWASGPIYQHKDDVDQQEFVNTYHDIQYPVISAGKATTFTATTLTVSTVTASSATFSNLTTGGLVFNPTTSGPTGTTAADDAAAGKYGEFLSSITANRSVGAANQYSDMVAIVLTPGDWELNFMMYFAEGTTVEAARDVEFMIGANAGNNAADASTGNNYGVYATFGAFNNSTYMLYVPGYRVNISGAATYYGKIFPGNYTGTAPKVYARLSARRMR